MAFLDQTFNANELPEGNSFEPLPAGWYNASVESAELKDTRNGTGQYINVMYSIQGPTHEGRKVFGNINIRNANPKAEEIGRQNLGDLMRSIGLTSVQDTDQLIGGNCQIKLAIRKSEQYGDQNDIKAWKPLNGGQSPQPQQPQAQTNNNGAGAPPWANQ